MNRILVLIVIGMGMLFMAGCSEDYADILDYETAEEFEQAINDGDYIIKGSYVMVEVKKIAPKSAFGYNIQAGEHLNFVDAVNPNAEVGDFVIFKVENIASIFGSYILTYEEHEVIKAEDMK